MEACKRSCSAGEPPVVSFYVNSQDNHGSKAAFVMEIASSYLAHSVKQQAESEEKQCLMGKLQHTAKGLQLGYSSGKTSSSSSSTEMNMRGMRL